MIPYVSIAQMLGGHPVFEWLTYLVMLLERV